MITANYLVTNFGFKRKVKDGEKLLFNKLYNITLKQHDVYKNHFVDVNTGEQYINIVDICDKFCLIQIEYDSKKFHGGLPDINLMQGNFNESYIENSQDGEFFMSHEKAKKLLEAQFNRKICNALMISSGNSNYDYQIKKCKYEFRNVGSDICTLTLYYNYSNGKHCFWVTHDIHNFDGDYFYNNRINGSKILIDLIIQKFLK